MEWEPANGERLRSRNVSDRVTDTSLGLPVEMMPDGANRLSVAFGNAGDRTINRLAVYSLGELVQKQSTAMSKEENC